MNPVLKGIVRFFDVLYEVSVAFARILLIAMLLIISANVFMRYVLNSGISWS